MAMSRSGSNDRRMPATGRRGAAGPDGGAQRRQVTILFCDLVRSAELTVRIDPEDMRDVLHAYLNAFAAAIEAAGGYIARYMGDGVMAYFGYPLAREGDPARAVRAALAVCAAALELTPPHGHRLAVRCGAATGLTVIGDLVGKGASFERGAIGTAPNLAARLQGIAEPGKTVICATTASLIPGRFKLTALEGLELKGFDAPSTAFVVEAASDGGAPIAEKLALRQTPFAGRANELAALSAAWRRAQGGQMTLVAVDGEAGIGKSRLVYEFQKSLAATPHLWFEAAADPLLDTAAYSVARRLILPRGGAPSADRVRDLMARAELPPEAAGLVLGMLGLAADRTGTGLGAEDRRRRLNEALTAWLIARARRQASVLVIEDLQWVDPSSLELLEALLATRAAVPLLVVTTSRQAARALGRTLPGARAVHLGRLDDEAVGDIVVRTAGAELTSAEVAALVRRSDGNPLFAEELAAHLATRTMPARALPETLIGLLTARLDATGSAAALARVASVLGPAFDTETLQHFARLPAALLEEELGRLTRAELITSSGRDHAFRHALIHEATYGSLLKDDRRALHLRAARLIAKLGGPAAVVARHWREAGDLRRAVDAYRGLGRSCVAEGAHGEAAKSYHAALEIVAMMPASPERDLEELELSSALTNALQVTEGYAAPAAVAMAARARVLAERAGDAGRLFNQVAAEWMAATSAGDYAAARELSARAMPLAEADGSADSLGTAFMMRMTTAYRVGALAEGEAVFQLGAPHFRAKGFLRRPGAVPQTIGNAAVNALLLGRRAVAQRRTAQVVAHGEAAPAPFVQAFAFSMAAMNHVLLEQPAEAAGLARKALMLSDAGGFPQFAATSRILLGRALAMQRHRAKGLALMIAGLDLMRANRSRNGMTMYLTWLAQTYVEARNGADARAACEAALEINPSERFYRAEALRVRAVCASTSSQRASYLSAALELARSVGSPWQTARILATADQFGVSAAG